jgi:pimeloyl-ACP methyl ester carboxylesterase
MRAPPNARAAQYLESLAAPLKGVVWFERSAHFPFFEEPERFRRELQRVDSLVSVYWGNHGHP